MLGIPTFFYDCYSQRTLYYLQEANHCISEISEILPEHTIIKEFRDMFFRMVQSPSPVISESLMREYAKHIQDFTIFLELFDELKQYLIYFEKKNGNRRLYRFYEKQFLRKQNLIFSDMFCMYVDSTLNSLMSREIKQEISMLKKIYGRKAKFDLTLSKIDE
jgi:hypothetical protein